LINDRLRQALAFIRNSTSKEMLIIPAGSLWGNVPFVMPSTSMIGLIWDDSFHLGYRHKGVDNFSVTGGDVTPVFSAHDGYLTCMEDRKSSVINPTLLDPLNLGQIPSCPSV